MNWFQTTAPIRLKLLIGFGTMTALAAVAAIAAGFGGVIGYGIAGGAILTALLTAAWFRKAISDSYVATVVRMEALAAGDVDTPIKFTDHRDCVGRMTKAMFTFRDTAVQQRNHAQEQTRVVGLLKDHLDAMAKGDLTKQITQEFPAAYDELKINFNQALDSLRGLLGTISRSANMINTGSSEITIASEDLARRTEGNAASLEQTSASLMEIDGRLKATATAASSTVERADQAISTVGGGRAVANEAVQAMGRVSDSAKGIDSVIEGLDKIAFQTRVLAMNAAVEAGRAGDAGRGFAVVADLVSALAMRAEEEAKRARDQLTVTQTDIVTAVDAVQKVDGALADISGDVAQVHQLLGSIAADNQAQSSAITEISAAISSMDQSTQQNAAMVEETSAAARNLTTEVKALTQQAARFNVGLAPAPAAAPTRTALPKALSVAKPYASPVKPLPTAAVSALVRPVADDWKEF